MEFKTLKAIFKHLFNFLILASLSNVAFANVMFVDGYVRAMPPSVPNTAAYLTIMNHNNDDIKLVAVNTDIAKEAQLHTLIEENGMIKMREVEAFDIASHGTLTLKPSGDHIMLLGLTAPLAENAEVSLTLTFDNQQTMVVTLPVLKKADDPQEDHSHHHHH